MGDYDNVYIIPQYSDVERGGINISTVFFGNILQIPVISSPMDTVSGMEMLIAMSNNGGYGIHHRYCTINTLQCAAQYGGIAVSPSIPLFHIEQVMDVFPSKIVVLDVAHGHTKRNLEYAKELVAMGCNVVSGNICTVEAAEAYLKIGVNHVRVGLGSGSVCTTRTVTGVGRPQYMAIPEIKEEFNNDIHIISDGGHATTGDIAKAFALGADFVMLGRMLASTQEALGKGKYSGMASADALMRKGKTEFFVEGITEDIKVNTTVFEVMKKIKYALETTCYYTGSRSLDGLYGNYGIK